MTNTKRSLPYIISVLFPVYFIIQNELTAESDVILIYFYGVLLVFGMCRLIEKMASLSGNPLLKWVRAILGISLYIVVFLILDYYYFDITLRVIPSSTWNLSVKIFFVATLYVAFLENIRWTKAREQSKIENLTLQTENVETQFNLLIQQVNPDFLFHCLMTLETMVDAEDPHSEDYILRLADVYRQTLKKERSDVTLDDELHFLKSFMFLMLYGQEEAIFFEMKVSDESLVYQLPVFSLQMLGENAIKHNTFSVNHPLYITLYQKDTKSITVSSNYQPKETKRESFGVGIDNLIMRYALAGVENAVEIEQNETTYATTIKLY